MMTAMQITCSACGAELPPDAPHGLCPACLFQLDEPPVTAPSSDSEVCGVDTAFGTRHFGEYELLEEIARGGMGIVYKARQPSIDRIVAVKMILFGSLANAEQVRRFRIEATAAGSLQHPNIVAVHEVGLHQGQNFMVMDYVDGPNLSRLVQDQPLPARKAAQYLKAIAEAVQFAHDRGILHRDLKPSNVLIGSDDRPRVTDFGLAKRFGTESSLTLSGHALGSPNYMPPEQSGGGRQKVGRTSDVYSLGAILYHLLTARPPFRAETVHETLQQVQSSEPLSPRLLNQSVPRDLETICLKCLEKEPAKRYATAQELADELGRFLKDEPINARPMTRPERAWRWCKRKPVVASLTFTSALLLLAVAIGAPIAAFRINQERLRTRESLYASDMRLASQAMYDGAFNHARELLRKHVPKRGARDLRGFEWRYLAYAVEESEPFRTLEGLPAPSGWEQTLLFGSEQFLYNQSGDQLKAWDMATWEPVPIVLPTKPSSARWQWDPAHEAVYALDQAEHTVTVYTLPRFVRGYKFRLPGRISRVTMSPDRRELAVGFEEGVAQRVLIWDLEHDARLGMLDNFEEAPSMLVFSRDGTLLAAGSTNGAAHIWSLKTFEPLPAPPRITNCCSHLEFTLDNKRLLSDTGSDLSVWDIEKKQSVPIEHAAPGLDVFGVSPDGKYLVVSWDARDLTLLDPTNFLMKGILRGHRGAIDKLTFSPDGRLIASASQDQTARIWDLETQTEAGLAGGFGQRICDVQFSADGQKIMLIGNLGQIQVYELSVVRQRGLFTKTHELGGFSRVAVSPDQGFVATISVAGTVALWNRQSGSLVRSNSRPRYSWNSFPSLAFSPDGERVAWVTGDALRIMVVKTGEVGETPINGNHEVNCVAFSPDGREVAFGGGKQLQIYTLASKHLDVIAATDDDVFAVGYSPDGARIAFGDRLGTVTLCKRADGKVLSKKEKIHAPHVYHVRFSPDGALLATSGQDSTIKLWRILADLPDGLLLEATLRGHMGFVNQLDFSPDGTRLASTSGDQTVKIWDPHRVVELATLYGHRGMSQSPQFTKDGCTIFSAGFDGEIRFWKAPPLAEIDLNEKGPPVQPRPVQSKELR